MLTSCCVYLVLYCISLDKDRSKKTCKWVACTDCPANVGLSIFESCLQNKARNYFIECFRRILCLSQSLWVLTEMREGTREAWQPRRSTRSGRPKWSGKPKWSSMETAHQSLILDHHIRIMIVTLRGMVISLLVWQCLRQLWVEIGVSWCEQFDIWY